VTSSERPSLSDEDDKLVTLARGAKARTGAPQGAAVRDGDGRTYAAATVNLPSLQLSALQAAVAIAAASAAESLEAAVVVGEPEVNDASRAAARELGADRLVLTDDKGVVQSQIPL